MKSLRTIRKVNYFEISNLEEPDFENQREVINGFSDTMVEVFGDRPKHAGVAVGMGSLPRNIAVEIEVIVEVRD